MTKKPPIRAIREGSFGFLIQTLARRIDAEMKSELKAIGLDVKVFANLMALAEEDGVNQRRLGEKLDFPEYFTSRAVDALVGLGLAERRPDPDSRRTQLVFLTEEGRRRSKSLPGIVKGVNDRFLSQLSPLERSQAVALLQKVAGISGHSAD